MTTSPAVRVLNASGAPVRGVQVMFTVTGGGGALADGIVISDANGVATARPWTLGTTAGPNSVAATVANLPPVAFIVDAQPDAAASLRVVSAPAELIDGVALPTPVVAELLDQYGNRAASTSQLISIQLDGAPDGSSLTGTVNVPAVDGVATFETLVPLLPSLPQPLILSVSPQEMTGGATLSLAGSDLGPEGSVRRLYLNGEFVGIPAPSGAALSITLPAIPSDCEPTRLAQLTLDVSYPSSTPRLRVRSSGLLDGYSQPMNAYSRARFDHPLRTAPQLHLAPGESRILTTSSESACVELAPTGGRYFVSVYSSETSLIASTSFALRGAASHLLQGGATAGTVAQSPLQRRTTAASPQSPRLAQSTATATGQLREAEAHTRMLQENIRIIREHRHAFLPGAMGAAPFRTALRTSAALDSSSLATVGSINEFRYSFSSCGDGFELIQARTAWVGNRTIILEDVNPFGTPELNNTLDDRYAQMGTEFESVMWPIVNTHFGNPLAVDAAMANHGRVLILFTPRVLSSGAQAFVFLCDFFPRTTFPKSNEAAIFYARVPVQSQPGFTPSTPDGWQWLMRSTLIHEAKHLASYAERISRNALDGLEEPWLEEGSARIAEELYGRAYYGNSWRDNSTFAATFACDLTPEQPQCAGRPFVMPKHFGATQSAPPGLYDYLDRSETRSILCPPLQLCLDATFYAGAWSMLRWAVDHFALSEATFLAPFTQNALLSGVNSLAATTGLSWNEMMGEWSLAMATDNLPGFLPTNPRLTFPGWDLRDVFSELNTNFPVQFPHSYPARPHSYGFTDFVHPVPTLVNGGFSLFEVSGAQQGRQLLALQDLGGGPPPQQLRMALVRVE